MRDATPGYAAAVGKNGLPTHTGSAESSWLCGSAADRQRMLDMDRRITPVRMVALGFLTLVALAESPWFGWWTVVPLLAAGVGFTLAGRLARDTSHAVEGARPEYMLFAAWVASEVAIAVTVLITGATAALLPWLAIPVITLSARFSLNGVIAGMAVALGLMAGAAFAVDPGAVIDYPPLLIAPACVVVAIGILSTALMRSDVEHRDEAVIDRLTGMLNRTALDGRVAELEQQSAVSGEPIGVIVGDLDHFKSINDSLGHATGDAVLRDVAYTLRKCLRAFDLAYRLGGEEFVMLLPGADLDQTAGFAERLREAIAGQTFGSAENVTMSFGIGASERGQVFDYDRVFAEADAGLYEAKRDGRDRVRPVNVLSPVPVPAG